MIKRFSPNNASRFRQKSLEELNEVTGALADDVEQIVDEVDLVESNMLSMEFDDTNGGIVFSIGTSEEEDEEEQVAEGGNI